jgi:hypothetical protein
MSTTAVVTFLEMLKTDETLATEYARATRESMQMALRHAVIEFAGRNGCDFTADELDSHLDHLAAALDDDELDMVAGGGVEPSPFADPFKGRGGHDQNLVHLLRPRGRAHPSSM